MIKQIKRLFIIRTKLEAYAVIYAITVGAVSRGVAYHHQYPGPIGWIMFGACCAVVFIAGPIIIDHVKFIQSTKSQGKKSAKFHSYNLKQVARSGLFPR